MMMKLWKRIAIEGLAVLGLVGDVLLMHTFGGKNCVLSLVLGLVLAAYCVLVFIIALRSGQVRQARMITLRHESGDVVLLSQETLDHLVASALGQPEGVGDVRVITGYHDESLEVMIDVSVSSNINIPITTARMQEAVRHQLGDVSGIALSGVSVKISTIKVPGEGEAIVPPQVLRPQEEPVVEEKAEEPAVEEPAEEPVAEEKAEEPAVEEPAEEPAVEESVQEPAVEERAEEPVIEEPVQEPVAEEPAEEPVTQEPVQEPAVREPAEVEDECFGEDSDPENESTAE